MRRKLKAIFRLSRRRIRLRMRQVLNVLEGEKPWKTPLLWTLVGVALSGAFGVLIFGGADPRWIPLLVALAIVFALPELVKNTDRRRKWQLATMITALGIAVLLPLRPDPNGRHLSKAQIEGIKRLADANPPGIKIIIRTAGNSPEAQRYGKEIWNVLYFRNRNVVGPFIIAAAEEPPTGLEVLTSSGVGPTWEAAERFQFGLGQLGMPSLIRYGYWAATDKSFVLFVGLKPNHD
jgi:hypothetical protein